MDAASTSGAAASPPSALHRWVRREQQRHQDCVARSRGTSLAGTRPSTLTPPLSSLPSIATAALSADIVRTPPLGFDAHSLSQSRLPALTALGRDVRAVVTGNSMEAVARGLLGAVVEGAAEAPSNASFPTAEEDWSSPGDEQQQLRSASPGDLDTYDQWHASAIPRFTTWSPDMALADFGAAPRRQSSSFSPHTNDSPTSSVPFSKALLHHRCTSTCKVYKRGVCPLRYATRVAGAQRKTARRRRQIVHGRNVVLSIQKGVVVSRVRRSFPRPRQRWEAWQKREVGANCTPNDTSDAKQNSNMGSIDIDMTAEQEQLLPVAVHEGSPPFAARRVRPRRRLPKSHALLLRRRREARATCASSLEAQDGSDCDEVACPAPRRRTTASSAVRSRRRRRQQREQLSRAGSAGRRQLGGFYSAARSAARRYLLEEGTIIMGGDRSDETRQLVGAAVGGALRSHFVHGYLDHLYRRQYEQRRMADAAVRAESDEGSSVRRGRGRTSVKGRNRVLPPRIRRMLNEAYGRRPLATRAERMEALVELEDLNHEALVAMLGQGVLADLLVEMAAEGRNAALQALLMHILARVNAPAVQRREEQREEARAAGYVDPVNLTAAFQNVLFFLLRKLGRLLWALIPHFVAVTLLSHWCRSLRRMSRPLTNEMRSGLSRRHSSPNSIHTPLSTSFDAYNRPIPNKVRRKTVHRVTSLDAVPHVRQMSPRHKLAHLKMRRSVSDIDKKLWCHTRYSSRSKSPVNHPRSFRPFHSAGSGSISSPPLSPPCSSPRDRAVLSSAARHERWLPLFAAAQAKALRQQQQETCGTAPIRRGSRDHTVPSSSSTSKRRHSDAHSTKPASVESNSADVTLSSHTSPLSAAVADLSGAAANSAYLAGQQGANGDAAAPVGESIASAANVLQVALEGLNMQQLYPYFLKIAGLRPEDFDAGSGESVREDQVQSSSSGLMGLGGADRMVNGHQKCAGNDEDVEHDEMNGCSEGSLVETLEVDGRRLNDDDGHDANGNSTWEDEESRVTIDQETPLKLNGL